MSLRDDALEFATRRHALQRYSGDRPYETHLLAVEAVLVAVGYDDADEVWRCAALLHDILEDTGTTRGELEERYDRHLRTGYPISTLVWAVTGVGPNRKQRNYAVYHKLEYCPAAAVLKLADRVANVEDAIATANVGKWAMYDSERALCARYVERVASHRGLSERLGAAYARGEKTLKFHANLPERWS